ncbi:MAG: hypothetical protein KDK36_17385 [Leptospiraceae bacterium]|nr:hypothetical protein [Leptospiraceae bacterium]
MTYWLKFFSFFILFFLTINCGTTVEFVPDPDFTSNNPNYLIKSFDEVEILSNRPKKRRVRIEGKVLVRKFEGNMPDEKDLLELKKLLYSYKLDGVWLEGQEIVEVAPLIFQTKAENGFPMTYGSTNKEMGRVRGIAFRYRDKK